MYFSDQHLKTFAENGWVLIPEFLSKEEVKRAEDAAWTYFPSFSEYEADGDQFSWLRGDQFSGEKDFPFSNDSLNPFVFHANRSAN
jgi:hypothetical protein